MKIVTSKGVTSCLDVQKGSEYTTAGSIVNCLATYCYILQYILGSK